MSRWHDERVVATRASLRFAQLRLLVENLEKRESLRSYRQVAKNRISRNGNALATRRRFICATGAAEFQRLVLGFIDDLVIRRRAGRARGRA